MRSEGKIEYQSGVANEGCTRDMLWAEERAGGSYQRKEEVGSGSSSAPGEWSLVSRHAWLESTI